MAYAKTPMMIRSSTHTKIKHVALCLDKSMFEVCEEAISFYISKHSKLRKIFDSLDKFKGEIKQ